jgi:hypothetical protein
MQLLSYAAWEAGYFVSCSYQMFEKNKNK